MDLLPLLPAHWPVAVVIAFHSGPRSVLVDVLRARSVMPVQWATSGAMLKRGHVYVAPAGHHLIVNPGARGTVFAGPRIRMFRPSADWLFESGSASFGDRHVAIILSGRLSDGALKLHQIRRLGGTVLVQEPKTSRFPEMPKAALATGHVDAALAIQDMPAMLADIFARRTLQSDIASWEDPFGPAATLAS